jgi:aminoglycoside phosphotransferase (APT) family kinase protein
MHADEIDSDADLVRRLLRAQQPQWAHLPVVPVVSTGTDNAMYRLGDDLVVRLPIRPLAIPPIEKEHRWLPVLAPRLPLAIPVPLARGEPSEEFPWPWSIYPWLDGEDATTAPFDRTDAARELARFLAALQAIDPTDGPEPSGATFWRGVPLQVRDRSTRQAIAAVADVVDADLLLATWEDALAAPAWDRPPVWVHGDIAAGNLLVRDGRLSAVIDFEALAVGDPACDVLVAWELFDGESRRTFRHELGVDDATWARARGWALSTAIPSILYYEGTNEFMATQGRNKLAAVLADSG